MPLGDDSMCLTLIMHVGNFTFILNNYETRIKKFTPEFAQLVTSEPCKVYRELLDCATNFRSWKCVTRQFGPLLYSGGIHRDWVGHPRRFFAPGGSTSWRCACVHDRDLDNPHLRVYPDCEPTAVTCKVNKEKLRQMEG